MNNYPVSLIYSASVFRVEVTCINYLPEQKKLVIENLGNEDQVGVQAGHQSSFRDYLKGRKRIACTFDGKQFIED